MLDKITGNMDTYLNYALIVVLILGGFGSVFWMWLIAIIAASSAFVESTLAQIYKEKGKDGCYGGPAYYIEAATKKRFLAVIFSVVLILTYGVGFNMLASYNLQSTFSTYEFYNPQITPCIIGGVTALLVGFCLFGGGKRIIKATSLIVPIIIALFITVMNASALPHIFKTIFTEAFDFSSIFGGFAGSCLMYGIKRGLFSNEAGVGSAPNASSAAEVSHPVKQGLVQILPVIMFLGKYAFRALTDYTKQRKAGKEPVFKAKDIDLPHETDYWN